MGNIIESVCGRISSFSEGNGNELAPKMGYKRVAEVYGAEIEREPEGWAFITDEESSARTKLRNDGRTSFMALISREQLDQGRVALKISLGKFGPFVQVDLEARYEIFNAADALKGNPIDETNRWGGSDTIGGSPRDTGTLLTLQELIDINNRITEIERSHGLTPEATRVFIADELPKILDLPSD